MSTHDPVVIVSAARTPMGSFQGDFASLAAHDLGGAAIKAAVERAGISPDGVGEVLFGNCLMAGQGQAPARQAAFKGGLPKGAGAVTMLIGAAVTAAQWHDTAPVFGVLTAIGLLVLGALTANEGLALWRSRAMAARG